MTRLGTLAASAALLGLASGAALAQAAAPAVGSNPTIPEKTAPGTAPSTSLDQKSGTLSEKLGDTDGVIKPSGDVDPAMHKPAPDTGSTPVIKPGTKGTGTGGLY